MKSTDQQIEDPIKVFLYHHGNKLVGFGKYSDVKFKDVPESYFIFCYENHRPNGTNKNVLEYGRLLKNKIWDTIPS